MTICLGTISMKTDTETAYLCQQVIRGGCLQGDDQATPVTGLAQ